MNWASASPLLADLVERPVVVVSQDGVVRLANHAAERMLRRSRDELVGQAIEALGPEDRRDRFEALREATRTNMRHRGEVSVRTGTGETLNLTVELVRQVGDGRDFVICHVLAAREEVAQPVGRDNWLEIRIDEPFGEIVATAGVARQTPPGARCHKLIFGLESPCAGCPATRLAPGESADGIRPTAEDALLLQRIYRSSPTTAQISYTLLDRDILPKLLSSRLDTLAAARGLSERERQVLDELATGSALEDIAETLAISERTVRFHQTNVLAKLGLESRLELLDLLLH